MSAPRTRRAAPARADWLYREYDTAEELRRVNAHYERPADFYRRVLGGRWHVYSASLAAGAPSMTAAQEAKLDLLAELMELRAGQRVLDLGCGWGGPLAYICKRYAVRGVGITSSPQQRAAAEERFASERVAARAYDTHWHDYVPDEPFDVVYTDEVITHFRDLGDFFARVGLWLRDGGRMVNKELHFAHPDYATVMTRAVAFLDELFAGTGNYRTLADELALVNAAGFDVRAVRSIPLEHYRATLDVWLANLRRERDALVDLVGEDYYRRHRAYLEFVRRFVMTHGIMTLDVVAAEKRRTPSGSAS